MALVLVLVIIVVLFLLGVAVAGLSSNNARLVMTVQESTAARQAALAGLSRARVALDASSDWTVLATAWATEKPFPMPSARPQPGYSLKALPGATAQSITVESRGYLENDDRTRRSVVVMTVRYQRCTGAFLYPVQANGAISLSTSSRVVADDIAIRTNATGGGSVTMDGSSGVSGDILVGPAGSTSGLVVPAPPAATDVSNAAGSAPMQPVTAPTLAPGLVVTGAPAATP